MTERRPLRDVVVERRREVIAVFRECARGGPNPLPIDYEDAAFLLDLGCHREPTAP